MSGLAKTATIEFERGIADSCEDRDCTDDENLHVFAVAADHGRNGLAVYCPECAELREDSGAHTYIGQLREPAQEPEGDA